MASRVTLFRLEVAWYSHNGVPFMLAAYQAWFPARIATCLALLPLGAGAAEALPVADAEASSQEMMRPYREVIEHTSATIDMVPVPGGRFLMGSPASEPDRAPDEGPQATVEVSPFWMSKFEITWDAYEVWMSDLDVLRRQIQDIEANLRDKLADEFQISKPTEPYTDMSFGMGKRGYPAICMTQHAARTFCQWLSAKTGRYYRLPTEAEWEYACRAGTTTAYSFGDDVKRLGEYGWFYGNSDDRYHKVGEKLPNPWGLYDMHGNVSEWVLDQYVPRHYATLVGRMARDPLEVPRTLYPRVVRGGSWQSDARELRSAARTGSDEEWKAQDPQIPQSIWYHTDAQGVGFRVVRPLHKPSAVEKAEKWDKAEPVQVDE